MRSPTVSNFFRTGLWLGGQGDRWRGMLVTAVQRIVGTGHKYFSPLDKAGRQEGSNHANEDFLNKRRVHWQL